MSLQTIIDELECALFIMNHCKFTGDPPALYDAACAVGRALRMVRAMSDPCQIIATDSGLLCPSCGEANGWIAPDQFCLQDEERILCFSCCHSWNIPKTKVV